MANFAQLSFQDALSPIITQLIAFHDHAILVLILVISIIGYAFFSLIKNSFTSRYLLEAQQIEII
jgi:cytochrome c oxidase subunit 2